MQSICYWYDISASCIKGSYLFSVYSEIILYKKKKYISSTCRVFVLFFYLTHIFLSTVVKWVQPRVFCSSGFTPLCKFWRLLKFHYLVCTHVRFLKAKEFSLKVYDSYLSVSPPYLPSTVYFINRAKHLIIFISLWLYDLLLFLPLINLSIYNTTCQYFFFFGKFFCWNY